MSLLHMKITKKKENKRKNRLMLNIEKYKDIVLENLDACSIYARLCRNIVNGYCEGFSCEGCGERVLKWLLEEAKEPVLDDAERKYLADVIRPFRDKIDTISKFRTWDESSQYIHISMKDNHISTLPVFPKGTMYKGMEDGKHYSLKELGL